MRRVLFIAFYFPPIGGSGVQRTVKFLRYLGDFGYEATVVTAPLGSVGHTTTPDVTLHADLPRDLVVERIPSPEPAPSGRWRGRAERWLRLRSQWSKWWVSGVVDTASRSGAGAALVFATMSPFESAAAASAVARRLQLPWVADLRDPWALDEMFAYPTSLHRRLELGRMRRLLSTASAIVMNTPEAATRLGAACPHLRDRIVTITNGYDAEDFHVEAAARDDDRVFRIMHTGDLHTSLGLEHRRTMRLRKILGGSLGHVDVLTRSHVFLLEALDRLIERRPDLDGRFELHLVGDLTPEDRAAMHQPYIRTRGYRPHRETVALMKSADLLFLPMHDLDPGARASIVPGKTYEYMAAGPPILAAVPDGDARDFLGAAGNVSLCYPRDVDAISLAVEHRLDAFLAGAARPTANRAAVERFERRRLTEALAASFDAVNEQGDASFASPPHPARVRARHQGASAS